MKLQEACEKLNKLAGTKVNDFLEQMKGVASESYRVLKFGKFCAILMGDTRQKKAMLFP